MGIDDRDYMREDPADWWKPGFSIKHWLIIGILAISLLTSLVYFGRSIGITKRFKRQPSVAKHATPAPPAERSRLVNLNTATIEELQTLPGIGTKRARLIVANRPYQSVDDLARLPSMGGKLVNDLRPLVMTEESTERIPPR